MSPFRVYRAASTAVRWHVWATVALVCLVMTVPLLARSEENRQADLFTPQNLLAAAGIVYGVGMLVQELRAVKKQLADAERTYVRADVVELRFRSLLAELQALRDVVERDDLGKRVDAFALRFEAFLTTVNTWTNAVEDKVHRTQTDLVRLEARTSQEKRL